MATTAKIILIKGELTYKLAVKRKGWLDWTVAGAVSTSPYQARLDVQWQQAVSFAGSKTRTGIELTANYCSRVKETTVKPANTSENAARAIEVETVRVW